MSEEKERGEGERRERSGMTNIQSEERTQTVEEKEGRRREIWTCKR